MAVGTAAAGVGCLTELLTVTVWGGLDKLKDTSDREFLIRLYDLAQKLIARNGTVYKDHASVVGMSDTATVGIDLLNIKGELCTLDSAVSHQT
jgi:hypothetical protein